MSSVRSSEFLSSDLVRRLEYVGGGYFRLPGPVGEKTFVIHAPELVRELLKLLDASRLQLRMELKREVEGG